MKRTTKKDEYGNYNVDDILDLGFDLEFEEFNKVTKAVNKLGKLEDIEEKLGIGLIELFESVGKDAYSIEDDYIIEYEIKAIEIEKDAWFIRTDVSNFGITKYLWLPDFNKTWFLTEEAAEKKLRELKNDTD